MRAGAAVVAGVVGVGRPMFMPWPIGWGFTFAVNTNTQPYENQNHRRTA
jgi:hypothetical protein